jgi:uncharacterized membrane protein YesL
MAKKKFNLFELFNPTKDGKGVKKNSYGDGWGKRDAPTFFKMYIENLSRLLLVNIYMIIGNFPLFFGLFAMGGYLNKHTTAPSSQLFGPVYGIFKINPGNPAVSALMGVHGIQTELSVNTTATLILFGLSGLALFTWGYVSVGTTYILRNIVKGEPIFMWDDFWYAIKRNLFQGMVVGILDVLFMGLLAYDVVFFYYNIGPFLNNVMFYFSILLAAIYFLMRFFIYILLITFNLKIRHIYKNAFIFSILNIKRNALAILGIAALVVINYALFIMYLPIGIILPFIITLSTGAFIAAYAAYPKIKEIMIDPYVDEKEEEIKEEPIFRDMG